MTQSILLCDDHVLVLQTLETFLEFHLPSVQIKSTEDFNVFSEILESKDTFDLAIIDFHMPGLNGIKTINQLINNTKNIPVAVLSGLANTSEILEFIELGAIGFIPKTLSAKGFVHAVNLMLCGEIYIPSFVTLKSDSKEGQTDLEPKLTDREENVLKKLHLGCSNKEIAKLLYIEEITVKVYVSRLCKKFEAKNRTAVVVAALTKGFL